MTAPPLGELYERLRSDGFAIGVDDHVRIGRLLALDGDWTADTLRIAVASLVVKDPKDRAKFDACWDRWLANARAKEPEALRTVSLPRVPPRPAPARWGVVAALGVVVVLGGVWVARRALSSDKPTAAARGSAEHGSDDMQPTPGPEPQVVDAFKPIAKDDVQLPSLPPPPPHSQPPTASGAGDLAVRAAGAGFAVLVGVTVAALVAARRRRRFLPGPWSYRLAIPPATRPVLGRLDVEDAAADLTWQSEERGDELDLDRSVGRTAAAGGLPQLVHRKPPAAARYLVLEDVGPGSEAWRFLYDELLRGLVREGIAVERCTFVTQPDLCTGADGKQVALRDLLEHADAMIVIGDGASAVDPISGEHAEWLSTLRHVARRLWINPLPPARWSDGARAIANDTPMEHGVAHALAAFHAGVDRTDLEHAFPAVIERAPATETALAALRAYLGEPAFELLCAVAVIGTPSIATARFAAEKLKLSLDEQAWLRLATLPWLVRETWPDAAAPIALPTAAAATSLRDRLRAAMPADARRRVEALAAERLVASEPHAGSAAHLAWQLDVASRRAPADAAHDLGQITATPLAHEARRRLAALGLPDRRHRLAVLVTALGGTLLLAGAGAFAMAHARFGAAAAAYAARAQERHVAKLFGDDQLIPWDQKGVFVVRVLDGNGDAVAGVPVTWSSNSTDTKRVVPTDSDGTSAAPLLGMDNLWSGLQLATLGDQSVQFHYTRGGDLPDVPHTVVYPTGTPDEPEVIGGDPRGTAPDAGAGSDAAHGQYHFERPQNTTAPATAAKTAAIIKGIDVVALDQSSLSAEEVSNQIRTQGLAAIGKCVDANTSAKRRAQVTFTIGMNGGVTSVNPDPGDLGDCIGAAARSWHFSPPPKDRDDVPRSANYTLDISLEKPIGPDAAALRTAVQNAYTPAVDACYAQLLKSDATANGAVKITLTVNKDADLIDLSLKSFSAQIDKCVTARMKSWLAKATSKATDKSVGAFATINLKLAPPECTEDECIMNNYAGACCAKYRQQRGIDSLPDTLDNDAFMLEVNRVKGQVIRCGNTYAKLSDKQRIVQVLVEVSPDGHVASVTANALNTDLGACIERALKAVTYPATKRGGTFKVPFSFDPQD